MSAPLSRLTQYLIVALILIAATWLRVGGLAALPPGLSSDESMNANDAFHISKVGPARFPFYENYGEPEPLFRFILSLAVPFLGPHIWIFRLTSALIGVMSVAAAYWTTRQVLAAQPIHRRWGAAAIAATSLAIALGHITLTRSLYRAVPLPLFILFFIGFLLRGLRRQNRILIGLSGLSLAAGFYTYTAGFFVPLALGPFALGLLLFERHHWRRWLIALALIGIVLILVVSPVAYLLVKSPERVLGRAAEMADVSVANASVAFSTISQRVVERSQSLAKGTLSVLFLRGDGNVQYNTDNAPVVPFVMQPLFAIGILALLFQWRQTRSWLLFSLILITAAPAVLSIEPAHGLRITGAFAIFPLVVGLGTSAVLDYVERFPTQIHFATNGLLMAAVLIGVLWARQTYVDFWQKPSAILMFGRNLTYGEWFFRPDQRDLALWIRSQSGPVLVPVDQLLPQTTHAWLLPRYPNVAADDEHFVLPTDTQVAIPWALELGDFNTDARHFALLDDGIITLLPPLSEGSHETLNAKLDSAPIVTRSNGNPLVKVIPSTEVSAITFDPPQVAAAPEKPIISLPNGLLVTSWWGPKTLSPELEQTITYMLNWVTTQPQRHDYYSFVGLLTTNNNRQAGVDAEMTRWLYPTWTWRPNTPTPVTYSFTVPAGLDPGAYRLVLIMNGELITIGWVKVPQTDPPLAEAGSLHPNALFNNDFLLYGADAIDEGNGAVRLSLYWQSQTERPPTDGIVFIHAQTKEGALVAQADAQPWGGQYPTFIWSEGERIRTDYVLDIGDTSPADVDIWVGMYTFPSLARLEITPADGGVKDNRLRLGNLLELLGQ